MSDSGKPEESKGLLRRLFRKRGRPKTRFGRILMSLRWVLYGAIALYILLLIFPQVIFPYSIEKHNIRIYSFQPLAPEAEARLDEIHTRLSRCELYDSRVGGRLFVCNDPGIYRLFVPFHGEMYAVSRPVFGHVFIARAEVETNRTGSPDIETSKRTFVSVAAHELTHMLIYDHLGFWGNFGLKRWVAEGYCEYVSGNYNYPELAGINNLIKGRSIDDPNFDYFTWETMVMYMIEVKGLDFDEILDIQDDYDGIKNETVQWLEGVYRDIMEGKQEKLQWPELD